MFVNPLDNKALMHALAEMLHTPDNDDPDRAALARMNRSLKGEEEPPEEEPQSPPFVASE